MNVTRDVKKLTAVYRVKLGEPRSTVAESMGIPPHTLGRWVADYQRPSAELLADLLAEAMVAILVAGPRGADLTGLVNAYKIVTTGADSDVFDNLILAGGQDAGEPQPEADPYGMDDE